MEKLLQKYKDNPTEKLKDRIKKHLVKHPFSWMMITREDAETLQQILKGSK